MSDDHLNSDHVSYDHLSSGTPERDWRALVSALAPIEAIDAREVLVLAAHPDDETLGAGGLIARCAQSGARVRVIVASDGDASHPRSPTHTPAALTARRRREVTHAVRTVAPQGQVEFLGLPDGRLADHEGAIEQAVAAAASRADLLVAPFHADRHPDHDVCGSVARAVAARAGVRLLEYPIWVWHWATPTELTGAHAEGPLEAWQPAGPPVARLRRLDLDDGAHDAKRRAIESHLSQTRPLSDQPGDEAILPPEILAHFERGNEVFVVAAAAEQTAYFDDLYAAAADPWGLGERFYEQRKRAALLAALPRPRFRRAFEPGCATGLLTEQLARRCDEVVAMDAADAAVEQTRARARNDHVRVQQGRIPTDWPDGRFDLIVLSEVGYYCSDLASLGRRIDGSLGADGVLIACHWRHPAPDHPHDAHAVHAELGRGLVSIVAHRERDFLLDVWSRDDVSTAEWEGLV